MRAGLIPSRMLQEKRIAYERAQSINNANNNDDASQTGKIKSQFIFFHFRFLEIQINQI